MYYLAIGLLLIIVFQIKGELFYNNLITVSVSEIWTRKTEFLTIHAKTTSNSRRNEKWIIYAFVIGTNEIHTFL